MPDPIYMDSFTITTTNNLISDPETIGQGNNCSEFKSTDSKNINPSTPASYPVTYSLSSRIRRRIY
jgi:hypothetical protein